MNNLDTVWVLLSAFLVFFMHAGFALLESGFGRKKNTVNILAKNVLNVALASLAFYFIGFGLMFGEGGLFGTSGFFPSFDGTDLVRTPDNLPVTAFFFFQMVFAATAATIVSGAVAERIKLSAFMIFAFILVLTVYPIVGHWVWGGGFLATEGFHDFAGSTVVHSVGGWAALTGVIILGPRIGKYTKEGKARAIPGHSMPLATLGMFILWLGWFGFNPGSQLNADGGEIARIALSTNMAAAAGGVTACIVAWRVLKAPDLSMIINGILAGLVAVTAGCSVVDPLGAIIIGGVAGVLVVGAVINLDRLRLDDPVGAVSVHLVGGVFGTLMVGFFSTNADVGLGLFYGGDLSLLGTQLLGVGAVGGFTVVTTGILWFALKKTIGIRVDAEDEYLGLDIAEHKMEAYPSDAIPGRGPSASHNADALSAAMAAVTTSEA
ncbi:MAG: ammonia permease [Deltaproteobacteria bacterium HGW-Deltaproteobacteria-14]|jgi:Amt family ammonium transporter|nr:MAG: ammonia permease [Deltaproteobacteria bacterium HGW-Deltaproteobacteria-14]